MPTATEKKYTAKMKKKKKKRDGNTSEQNRINDWKISFDLPAAFHWKLKLCDGMATRDDCLFRQWRRRISMNFHDLLLVRIELQESVTYLRIIWWRTAKCKMRHDFLAGKQWSPISAQRFNHSLLFKAQKHKMKSLKKNAKNTRKINLIFSYSLNWKFPLFF